MSVSFSQIQSASRFSGNSISSVLNTTNEISFSTIDGINTSLTLRFGDANGNLIGTTDELEPGETYWVYAEDWATRGNAIWRQAFARNLSNWGGATITGDISSFDDENNPQFEGNHLRTNTFFIVSSNGEGEISVSLIYDDGINSSGSGSRAQDIEVSDPEISLATFGQTLEGDGATATRTITNTGGGTLSGFIDFENGSDEQIEIISTNPFTETVLSIDSAFGSGFGSYSLEAGESLTIELSQERIGGDATGSGTYSHDLRVTHNASNAVSPLTNTFFYDYSS